MTMATDVRARPRLVGKAMLRYDQVRETHLLLLPERVVRLNASSAAILTRCDGAATVAEIIEGLEAEFGASGLRSDVMTFLGVAREHGWIEI
jgi:pyrroloquinoline quinone biosynthesis protein D